MNVEVEGFPHVAVISCEISAWMDDQPEELRALVRPGADVEVANLWVFVRHVMHNRTVVLAFGRRWVVHHVDLAATMRRRTTVSGLVLDVDAEPRSVAATLTCWPDRTQV